MKVQLLLAKVFATTAAKVTAVAVVGVAGGAAVAGGVSHEVYQKQITQYEATVNELKDEVAQSQVAPPKEDEPSLVNLEGEIIRVYDGIVQIWDGQGWNEYASVSDIEAKDPFHNSDEKRAQIELEVLNEKLEEAGLKVDESGEIVVDKDSPAASNGNTLIVGTTAANNPSGNKKQETVTLPVVTVTGLPVATPAAAVSSGNSGGGGGGGDNGGGGGGGSSEPSYSGGGGGGGDSGGGGGGGGSSESSGEVSAPEEPSGGGGGEESGSDWVGSYD